jgi:glycosyltransferase involved in cell wall biosynthesis
VGENHRDSSDPRFHYTGYLTDPQRVVLYYQAADVLLHAANVDNFPCVILEALACGTPVIATAVGGIPEQIVEGETGFLVPRGDSALMAQRVLELINQPEICQRMGQAAFAYARRAFDQDRQAGTYLQWFEDLHESFVQSVSD